MLQPHVSLQVEESPSASQGARTHSPASCVALYLSQVAQPTYARWMVGTIVQTISPSGEQADEQGNLSHQSPPHKCPACMARPSLPSLPQRWHSLLPPPLLAPARWEAQSPCPGRQSFLSLPPLRSCHMVGTARPSPPSCEWRSAASPTPNTGQMGSPVPMTPLPRGGPAGLPKRPVPPHTCQVSGAVCVTLAVGVALLDGGGTITERGGEDGRAVLHQRRADGRVVARRGAVQRCPRSAKQT